MSGLRIEADDRFRPIADTAADSSDNGVAWVIQSLIADKRLGPLATESGNAPALLSREGNMPDDAPLQSFRSSSRASGGALNDMQTDALTELINVGVSSAAVRLRGMVGTEVTLTVPAVSLVTPDQATVVMVSLGMDTVVAVHQGFSGAFSGETLLVVPHRNSAELLRLVLGEFPDEEGVELYEDALKEIGNVLLGGFLSTVGKLVRRDFQIALPRLTEGEPRHLLAVAPERVVLFIYVNFGVRGRQVTGYFALVLGLESMTTLRQIVDEVILQVA